MAEYYTPDLIKRIGSTWASIMRCQDGDDYDQVTPCIEGDIHKYITYLEKYLPDRSLKILEIGAGDGSETRLLMDAGWNNITGITVGHGNVLRGKETYNVDLLYMDMHFMDFPCETFDAIIGFQTYEHTPAPILLGLEFNRVLKSDGKILLEVPIGEQHMPEKPNPHHLNVVDDWQARAQLAMSGFTNIETVKVQHDMMTVYGEKREGGSHNNHFNDLVNGKFLRKGVTQNGKDPS
jgi:SAM-dependent methyltransferase